jgi:nucleoside-diphosphate-sugar epimerase
LNNKIFLFGYNGFVGSNFIKYRNDILCCNIKDITKLVTEKADQFSVVINFIGKAHDLKNVSNPIDYYSVNTDLTKVIFDAFLASKATVFITLSSVKAVADEVDNILMEDAAPNPITHYGKSKLLAEKYICSKPIPDGKRVYILRPCMVHGPGNKGNLNLLYSLVSKGLPWPLGLFKNSRSYLSIDNLCFIMTELIERDDIPSGVYNVADDIPLSTKEVINIIAESKGKKARILNLSMTLIKAIARVGDLINLPLDSERLQKLTESYVVSNAKIKSALGKPLPVSSKDGLIRTFKSFADNA